MTVLHLTGPVLVDEATVAPQAWVVGGRITFERPALSGDVTRVDGYVVPGLVDVHCHVGLDSGGGVDEALATKQAEADRDTGVLLIRDAGSASDTSFVHGRDDLPRLIRSARFIARPKRYLPGYATEVEVEDLPRVAAEQARAGDGWVKLIADWIDRDAGDLTPLWPDEVLAAGIAAAHAEGARVTAHTFATETLDGLLAGGIDCIEHGTGMTADHMELAAARGIPVVPTLLQVSNFASFAAQGAVKFPAYAARMNALYERRYEQVRQLAEAGVTLLLGTDAGGSIGHGSFHDEIDEWRAAGVADAQIVGAATWTARAFLGAETLTEGASADLIVTDGDPRVDARRLRHHTLRVLRGETV